MWQRYACAQYEAAPESYYLHQKLINQVDFTDKTTSPLNGLWQYYPEQLIIKPSSVLKSETVQLPISFTSNTLIKNLKSLHTFQLSFLLSQNRDPRHI